LHIYLTNIDLIEHQTVKTNNNGNNNNY